MITIEKTEVSGFSAAIRGLRNPMNSWEKSDSHVCDESTDGSLCTVCPFLTAQQYKTFVGQYNSDDEIGALMGLWKVLKRQQLEESYNGNKTINRL